MIVQQQDENQELARRRGLRCGYNKCFKRPSHAKTRKTPEKIQSNWESKWTWLAAGVFKRICGDVQVTVAGK